MRKINLPNMRSLKNDNESDLASSRPQRQALVKNTFQDAAKKPLEDDDSVIDVTVTPRGAPSRFTSGQNTMRESFTCANRPPPGAPSTLIFQNQFENIFSEGNQPPQR